MCPKQLNIRRDFSGCVCLNYRINIHATGLDSFRAFRFTGTSKNEMVKRSDIRSATQISAAHGSVEKRIWIAIFDGKPHSSL